MNRYDSYKDSGVEWIGRIPNSWDITPLYSVSYHTKEKNIDKCETVLSLSYGRIVERNVEKNHGLLPSNFDSYQRIRPEYVVLRLTDLQNDKKSLRVGYSELDGIITSVYVSLGTKENYNGKYLYYQLHNSDIKKVLYTLGSGLRQSLRYDELKRFPLLRISLNEQQKIVSFLDNKTSLIDSLIEKTQRKIELLKEKRTSLINEVVTKGLNPNVEMKDSGVEWIGEIPSHWEYGKVKFFMEYKKGYPFKSENMSDEGIPIIKVTSIKKLKINTPKTFFKGEFNDRITIVKEGDIIITTVGSKHEVSNSSVGQLGLVEKDQNGFLLNQNTVSIRTKFNSVVYNNFIFNYFQSKKFRNYLDIHSHGTVNQSSLNVDDILNFNLPYPPISEQQQIVEYLDEQTQLIDNTISIEEKRIELLKEYRQSLISEVVTGKRKVVK